jgi:PAS domain S-box-containing protein
VTEQVARTGERVSIANVDEHPIYAGRGWGGSIISIPLVVGEQVLGVMNLTFDKPYGFTESDIRFLDLLSDQAAIALHNAKLYQQLSLYTDDLEQRVDERTRQLRIINEQISAFFRNSADAIVLCDIAGRISQVNPAYARLCGLAEPDGDIFSTLRPVEPSALKHAIQQVMLGAENIRTELTLYGMNNAPLDFDVSLVSMASDDPDDTRIIITLHDITNRKRLEEELRNALEREREIRELKGRFTSMVSHEFRTPLAVIQSSSELLARYSERMTEQRRRDQLSEIQHQVRNLVALLDDVLTISRAENVGVDFKPAPLDLVALCQTTLAEIQATTSRHELLFTTTGDCVDIWGDSKLLQQALRNLLTNAIKYSPAGGAVELSLQCNEREVVLRVTDHGIGIPEADQKYLFEAFHRAKNVGNISGTGLGLSIVSQAVDVHNGRIDVESQLGAGTTFIVTLPRHKSQS